MKRKTDNIPERQHKNESSNNNNTQKMKGRINEE